MITMENVLALADLMDEVKTATHDELLSIGCDPEELVTEGYLIYVGDGLYESREIELLDISPSAVGYKVPEGASYCKGCFFDPEEPCWQDLEGDDNLENIRALYLSSGGLEEEVCVNCQESLLDTVLTSHKGDVQ
jgi:hypothetical protein